MKKCLVTGAAGFIGSHLSEKLLHAGYQVVGIDCLTDYYSERIKKDNLLSLMKSKGFQFVQADLCETNLDVLLNGVYYVFHQAAQAGVRASWGKDFEIYTRNNIEATQKLLEKAKDYPLEKFVFASSSSVYGDVEKFPMNENDPVHPVSPYGVTKLASENLCVLYYKNFQVPTVSLRYFTVYGPRQRPDMAFHKFIKAVMLGEEIVIYGDGEQTRDFTFFSDAIEANYQAALKGKPGAVYNVGGGSKISVNQLFPILEKVTGKPVKVKYIEKQKGDVNHTAADISKAQADLTYKPQVDIQTGLEHEAAWIKEKLESGIIS